MFMDDIMDDPGLILFLLFVGISLIVITRASIKGKEKKKHPKRQYRPYEPADSRYQPSQSTYASQTRTSSQFQPQSSARSPSTYSNTSTRPTYTQTPVEPRNSIASPRGDQRTQISADEHFRSGNFDRAKEEYLKTGRIFGAAKSAASKGRNSVNEALDLIKRHAPEREEEMVRNLSRYFFDTGDIELAGIILHRYGLKDEASAILATISKTYEDLERDDVANVGSVSDYMSTATNTTQQSYNELTSIAKEMSSLDSSYEPIFSKSDDVLAKDEEVKQVKTQTLKVATTDLDSRCSVCMSAIRAGDTFVRCPHCETPAHYAHLIEWIKVKTQCPHCRNKITARMFQN